MGLEDPLEDEIATGLVTEHMHVQYYIVCSSTNHAGIALANN